ncbi:hypothetical protein RhiirA1_462762 [Rhizophagus irregularis]|uniref:DUF8211 domain-containing protein n=1 Tax=Rhizophagus irregularis TaxID=588596 RepID=A0A2N0RLJ2_9GLOM|nr:hypothetical protein RhiirA1_462762 [Rhizophagus irregularis]
MYRKRIDNFQHRFLFLPSQYINKPIQHLKYHKKSPPHIKKDYGFPIPSDYIKISPVDQKTSTVGNSLPPPPHTEENPIPSEEGKTWHPTLDILIDDDHFLYVPNKPIYGSKKHKKTRQRPLIPGSELWLKAVKHHKAFQEELNASLERK